jgi:TRAP transporter TAXI family solute receptor
MKKQNAKDVIRYFAPALAITFFGFLIAYQFVSPAPPRHITIATGQPTGNYYAIGQQYKAILARDKVTLHVRETSGSVENLHLIADPESGVDIIFMQGGTSGQKANDELVSLASVYYEPLWVFYRSRLPINYLSDLKGLRIAVGPEDSGTRQLAMQLLTLNDVSEANSQILNLPSEEAAGQLLEGRIDAAFFVIGKPGPSGMKLLRSPEVNLLSFERADAYTRRLPFLSHMILPKGTVDLTLNLPAEDVSLIVPTAQLVARKGFHPALIDLLLLAAGEVSAQDGWFAKPGDFPTPRFTDFALSSESKRFFSSGPPFLRRYLPFWLANFMIRMKIMLLPLLALLFPLLKLLPPFYQWRVRSRIFRWYDQILEIDYQMLQGNISDQRDEFVNRLDWIEKEVSQISVPRGYYRELYDMRVHIEMLRAKLLGATTPKASLLPYECRPEKLETQ